MLTKQVHGNPGPQWTSDLELDAALNEPGAFSTLLASILSGKEVVDAIEDDDQAFLKMRADTGGDAEEMDWWDVGGGFFSVPEQNMVPLQTPGLEAQCQSHIGRRASCRHG